MKNMNEIIKYDKQGNITKEWLEYVENLDREDLERFFIGAYTLSDKRKEIIDKAIELLNSYTKHYAPGELYIKEMLLEILKSEDKKLRW